jgi:thioredoxin-dependent peroxiredoxin
MCLPSTTKSWPAKEITVQEGDKAPDFELLDENANPVRLSDFSGQTVVLYFYPKADTPGCTTQACGIRDRFADYAAAGAAVIGVSPDSPQALRKFKEKYGLRHTLLSDADHRLADAFDVWVEKTRQGKTYFGNERSTFVIGPDGVVARSFRKVSPQEHDELILQAIA